MGEFRPCLPRLSSPVLRSPVMPRILSHKLETQGSGNRRRLDELHGNRIAEPVRDGAADKGAAGLVKAEIFVADGARRDETVGSGGSEPEYARRRSRFLAADRPGPIVGLEDSTARSLFLLFKVLEREP